jgi:hypothetical protein
LLLPLDVGLRRLVLEKRDLVALTAAVRHWREPAAAETPLVSSLSTVRAQRDMRAHRPTSPGPEPARPSQADVQPREAQPRPAAPPASRATGQTTDSDAPTLTQLLAAKRRRR